MAKLVLTAIEPSDGEDVHFLAMAPAKPGAPAPGHINLWLQLRNDGSQSLRISQIMLAVPGSSTPAKTFATDLQIAPGAMRNWAQTDDYTPVVPAGAGLQISLTIENDTATTFSRKLVAHKNQTSNGAFRFWSDLHDLRPDEYWLINGTGHGQSNPAQLFAYDVGMAAYDPDGSDHTRPFLPGTDGSQNADYRIWGKIVRAVADGVVMDFRNDFPTNARPGTIDPAALSYWGGGPIPDGNGNFFVVATGDENVLYAHMQPGTLNRDLLRRGARVTAGQFLGLVGNSGASSAPHLHIHACRPGAGNASWEGAPRPMVFDDLWAVSFSADAWLKLPLQVPLPAPPIPGKWVKLSKQGFATGRSAVWPSHRAPEGRQEEAPHRLTVAPGGKLWIADAKGKIFGSSSRLRERGLYLDLDAGRTAVELAASDDLLWAIGTDRRVYRREGSAWSVLAQSPECKRIAADGASGTLWALRSDGHIVKFEQATGKWSEHPGNGIAKDIAVLKGTVMVIGTDDRIWQSAGAKGWHRVDDETKAVRLTADNVGNGALWLLQGDRTILSGPVGGPWSNYATAPKRGPSGEIRDFAVLNGRPLVCAGDGRLYIDVARFGWSPIPLIRPAA